MAINHSLDANALCPFFIKQEDKHIECEGYIRKAKSVRQMFSGKPKRLKYFEEICSSDDYECCRHYQIMNNLYNMGVLK